MRSEIVGTIIWICGAWGPETASLSSPPAGPRVGVSLRGAQRAARSAPTMSGQSDWSRAWAKPRRAWAVRICWPIRPPACRKPRAFRFGKACLLRVRVSWAMACVPELGERGG